MGQPVNFPFRSQLGRVRRQLKRQAPLNWRPLSFPFISGDTFRNSADIIVDTETSLERLNGAVHALGRQVTVFVWVGLAERAIEVLMPDLASRVRLVIHNGDVIPEQAIRAAAAAFDGVFCINWLDLDFPFVTPLPIGLENAYVNTNGRPQDFQDCLPSLRPTLLTQSRRYTALCAIRTWTNEGERAGLPGLVRSLPNALVPQHRLSVGRHQQAMADSYFVFSPPGNGPDCYRTWEAIYRGAVPIVLRKAWAFESLNLPVLVVDDWHEAFALLDDDPVGLYRALQERDPSPAYAEYHLAAISRPLASPAEAHHLE